MEDQLYILWIFWESYHWFFIFDCGLVQLRITAVTIHGGTPIGDFTQSLMEDLSGVVSEPDKLLISWAGPWNNPQKTDTASTSSLRRASHLDLSCRCEYVANDYKVVRSIQLGSLFCFCFGKRQFPPVGFFLPFLNMRPCSCASDMYPWGHSGEIQHASPRRSLTSFSGFLLFLGIKWMSGEAVTQRKETGSGRSLESPALEACLLILSEPQVWGPSCSYLWWLDKMGLFWWGGCNKSPHHKKKKLWDFGPGVFLPSLVIWFFFFFFFFFVFMNNIWWWF